MACMIVLQEIKADLAPQLPRSISIPVIPACLIVGGGWQVKVQVTDRNGSVCVDKKAALLGKL